MVWKGVFEFIYTYIYTHTYTQAVDVTWRCTKVSEKLRSSRDLPSRPILVQMIQNFVEIMLKQLSFLCLMFKHLLFLPVNGISIAEKKKHKSLNMEFFSCFISYERISILRKYHIYSIFKELIVYFPVHEVNVMWIHNTDLGRRSPGGDRVLCREYVPSRYIRSSGRASVNTTS